MTFPLILWALGGIVALDVAYALWFLVRKPRPQPTPPIDETED